MYWVKVDGNYVNIEKATDIFIETYSFRVIAIFIYDPNESDPNESDHNQSLLYQGTSMEDAQQWLDNFMCRVGFHL